MESRDVFSEKPRKHRKSMLWRSVVADDVNLSSTISDNDDDDDSVILNHTDSTQVSRKRLGQQFSGSGLSNLALLCNPPPTEAEKQSGPKRKTTELHEACANSNSIQEIRTIMRKAPYLAGIQDETGQLPLHLIATNEKLFEEAIISGSSEDIDSFILDELMVNDPLGPVTTCHGGFIPFEIGIFQWIENAHAKHTSSGGVLRESVTCDKKCETKDFSLLMPATVTMSPRAEWCFHMFSSIICSFKKSSDIIVNKVAALNSFVKTVLFINDEEDRSRILGYEITKQVMCCGLSCGTWLEYMVASTSERAQEKAVTYLKMISDQTTHSSVYMEAVKYPNLIVSMLKLPEKLFREAAATDVIQWSLDQIIFRPMSLLLMTFDIFNLILFAVFFQLSSLLYFGGITFAKGPDGACDCANHELVFYVVMISLANLYFTIRNAVVIRKMAWSVFVDNYVWKYFVEFTSVGMSLSILGVFVYRTWFFEALVDDQCEFLDKSVTLRTATALASMMIFIKTLLWIKMVNRYLATFVLAILEITKDIMWFLLVLVIILVMFANMFHIILYQPNSENCKDQELSNPFCNESSGPSYLEVYTMMFGEFNVEFFYTTFSTVLFVVYTFSVVIIMLNVLIAIVSDAYDKSALQSTYLFQRARVLFVTELLAYQGTSTRKSMENLRKAYQRIVDTACCKCFSDRCSHCLLAFFLTLLGKSSTEISVDGDCTMGTWNGRLSYMEEDVKTIVGKSEARLTQSVKDSVDITMLDVRRNVHVLHSKIANNDDITMAKLKVIEERLAVLFKSVLSEHGRKDGDFHDLEFYNSRGAADPRTPSGSILHNVEEEPETDQTSFMQCLS